MPEDTFCYISQLLEYRLNARDSILVGLFFQAPSQKRFQEANLF